MTSQVRVRFAPSPTGYLHIGGVRTCIYNYFFARRHHGTFILRIEDTDRERSTKEALDQILDSLEWLGLKWDEGPFLQSDRTPLYNEHLQRLLANGKAYRCYCNPEELEEKRKRAEAEKRQYKYDGRCRDLDPQKDPAGRPFTVRFRCPKTLPETWDDLVLGRLPFEETFVDDWILARSDGTMTYNYCVVVDDATMKISHVIRGNDHVMNTPKQILLYQAFGYTPPQFAHHALTHGPDNSKLSKRREEEYRKMGFSVSVQEYRNMGYLSDALVNYLARLGWSHGDQEIFSRKELEELFDLDHVSKSAGVLNPEKLKWVSAHYVKETPTPTIAALLVPFLTQRGFVAQADQKLEKIVELLKPRAKTLVEMADQATFFFKRPEGYAPAAVKKWLKPGVEQLLLRARARFADLDLGDEKGCEEAMRLLAEQLTEGKLGKVAQPLRIAITGGDASPPLFTVLAILGKEETLRRIDDCLKFVQTQLA